AVPKIPRIVFVVSSRFMCAPLILRRGGRRFGRFGFQYQRGAILWPQRFLRGLLDQRRSHFVEFRNQRIDARRIVVKERKTRQQIRKSESTGGSHAVVQTGTQFYTSAI